MSFDHRLAEAFMFDELDLHANRSGRFSESQALGLRSTADAVQRRRPVQTVALFVLFAVLVVLAAFVVASSGGSGVQLAVVLAILAAFAALIGLLRAHARRRGAALLDATVHVAHGPVDVALHSSGGASGLTSYRVVVDGRRFVVDWSQAEAFVDGAVYRVHFTTGLAGLMILSAEPG